MKNKKIEGHLSMLAGRTFGGLNSNALKYLLPLWISPLCCVAYRLVFGAIVFWIIGFFIKNEPKVTIRTKIEMFLLGLFGLYAYMMFYMWGLSHTTPVSSSIIMAMIPIWVFIILLCFRKERFDFQKGLGLFLGLCGACVNIFTKKGAQYADDPMLGDLLTVVSTLVYSGYLILSHNYLKKAGVFTVTKWTFLGGAVGAVCAVLFLGYDVKLFERPFHWLPILILGFVLIFASVLSYLLLPIGLKYLKATAVAMYGYWVVVLLLP